MRVFDHLEPRLRRVLALGLVLTGAAFLLSIGLGYGLGLPISVLLLTPWLLTLVLLTRALARRSIGWSLSLMALLLLAFAALL